MPNLPFANLRDKVRYGMPIALATATMDAFNTLKVSLWRALQRHESETYGCNISFNFASETNLKPGLRPRGLGAAEEEAQVFQAYFVIDGMTRLARLCVKPPDFKALMIEPEI
jgi:hypothetical protein